MIPAAPLRVLIVEDSPLDADLLVRELRRGGLDVVCERVDTREGMAAALDGGAWDVVVSDYSMPRFSAPLALGLVKERGLDIPFIIVSGVIAEDTAVEAMRSGAHDFMAKGKLARLIPAIQRELRDAALRAERGRMQAEFDRENRRMREEVLRSELLATEARAARELAETRSALLFDIEQKHEALKAAQSQLVQAEKLAALGQTVAGVAHEINNPLAFVTNNLAVLQRDASALREVVALYREADRVPDGEKDAVRARIRTLDERFDLEYTLGNLDALIVRSREGLQRIRQIVSDLREFARLDEGDLQPADLNAGIESTLRILGGAAKRKGVDVVVDLGELPTVSCHPAKLNQVVMNLVNNALQACSPGGHVTVSTRRDGDVVLIRVVDDGAGIPEAIRAKIFDPFFTTKKQGEGIGLGLSISYGIVRDHGGRIEVEASSGAGTAFLVTLPLAAKPPASGA